MKKLQPLRISVLNDNVAGRWCRAEHGLSFLIEADEVLLFDTGSSDLIAFNAKKMGVDLGKINTVVLSHGHDDHTGGLMLFENKVLVCHPDTFLKRFRKSDHTQLGIRWTKEEIESRFSLAESHDPVKISNQIYFLGEIPRLTEFENQSTAFVKEDGSDDFVNDDSGLAIITEKGLVVVSGCAHSGICNMTAYAKKVTGINEIHAVIGGFHLQNNDLVTKKTIEWMKENRVEQVIPSHCTSFAAQAEILKSYRFTQVKSGNTIVFG